jgi:hypothetical protein
MKEIFKTNKREVYHLWNGMFDVFSEIETEKVKTQKLAMTTPNAGPPR